MAQRKLDDVFIGTGQFMVPTYQRGYAWEDKQIDEFVRDLTEASDEATNYEHFFGFMMTVLDKNGIIKIIDGQQRMTTIMLFLICARNFFYKHNNLPLAQKYLKSLEKRMWASNDQTKPRIRLSRTNREFFQKMLTEIPITPSMIESYEKSDISNRLLANAYSKLRSWVNGQKIAEVNKLCDTLFTKFILYHYKYKDDDTAYRIFNLINNRGIHLVESDHIKDYLFGELEKTHNNDMINEYDEQWNKIRNEITATTKANFNLDTFFHHYMIATSGYASIRPKQIKMYKAFRDRIELKKKTPENVIDRLYYWAKIMNVVRNPTLEHFDNNATIVHYLKKIRAVSAIFVYPAILVSYERYWSHGDKKLFEIVVMLCFKYHIRIKIIGTSGTIGDYESIMYEIARGIIKDNDGSKLEQIITELIQSDEHYPDSEQVKVMLETMSVKSSKHAVALLQEVEYVLSGKRSLDPVTVEHIMPKNPIEWEDYIIQHNKKLVIKQKPKNENMRIIHRKHLNYLGNQTLLSRKNNKAALNKPFEEKKEEYEKHKKYKITEQLIHVGIWNVDQIMERHRRINDIILKEVDLNRFVKFLNNYKK